MGARLLALQARGSRVFRGLAVTTVTGIVTIAMIIITWVLLAFHRINISDVLATCRDLRMEKAQSMSSATASRSSGFQTFLAMPR
jgi:hypothetical protein